MRESSQSRPQKFTPYIGERRYTHVSPERPCRICGKPDWCSYSANEEVSYCARTTVGAHALSKKEGWGIFFHTSERGHLQFSTPARERPKSQRRHHEIPLAPLEIRDAVYQELIRLSPSTNYRHELIDSPNGLLARGFSQQSLTKFGALPPTVIERARLARELRLFVLSNFYDYAQKLSRCGLLGIPGFWQDSTGAVGLWMNYDESSPSLIIPYRDQAGLIQACQVRRSGALADGTKRYSWMATPKLRNGVTSGTPIHHTFQAANCLPPSPILITEGALKAEAFAALRPNARVVATSGVTCSHEDLIAATRGHDALVGFDADHRQNKVVCRHLGRLLAGRELDRKEHNSQVQTKVIIWDPQTGGKIAKGIDDAALLGVTMKAISIGGWFDSLVGDPQEEVKRAWKDLGYAPQK